MTGGLWRGVGRLALGAALASFAAGCSTLAYYGEAAEGHLELLHAARPIDTWLADPATPEALRARLERVRAIRTFASRQLGLPDNASYLSYARLDRPYVVWNVFAAPALSLELRHWCYPIAGCVAYRGYFSRERAEGFASELKGEGLDVMVGGVPAYSTLGHTPDPVLSTFIDYPDAELARLIFHELAHQEFYLAGDTTFNESFATSVEEEGVRRWLKAEGDGAQTDTYHAYEARRNAFVALIEAAREHLASAYRDAGTDGERRAAKERIIGALRADYARARADRSSALYGDTSYGGYFGEQLNNASLAAVATYTQRVPAFVKLLEQQQGDLPRFYDAVKALGALDQAARDARLDQLQGVPGPAVAAAPH